MSESARLVTVGTTDGGSILIQADVTNLGGATKVTLSADYAMLGPPGYPARPSFTGAATPQYPHTISNGTTLTVLACEATALVNAGKATLA